MIYSVYVRNHTPEGKFHCHYLQRRIKKESRRVSSGIFVSGKGFVFGKVVDLVDSDDGYKGCGVGFADKIH